MVPHHAAPTETLRAPRKSARHYRGVLRSIADSVDGNFEAALDYVLVKHGTQDGSSYAPTQWSDARELDGMLGERDAHLRAPKGMSAEDATATLESIGAIDAMESRRAQLLADGYSASLARAPHYVTLTDERARLRYRDQITRIFARFLVLAFTAFDGRLVSYLREHQTRY